MKSIRKSMWGMYWKLHDKRKRLAASLKGYLDGLPPETRRRIVLGMFAAFAVLAVTERSLVTTCRLLNASRSDDNPNGFTIEGFTIIENKDLQTIKR